MRRTILELLSFRYWSLMHKDTFFKQSYSFMLRLLIKSECLKYFMQEIINIPLI